MLSPFCCTISYRLRTKVRFPERGTPIRMNHFGSWTFTHKPKGNRTSQLDCTYLFNVVASHRHSLRPKSHKRLSKFDPRLMLGAKLRCCNCGNTRPRAIKQKLMFEKVWEDKSPTKPKSRGTKDSLKILPVLALTLSTVLGCQQACAEFQSTALAWAAVQEEVISSNVPSVESILAKQLARRFQEMSEEELVDILQQLLKASRSSQSSQIYIDDGTAVHDSVNRQESRQVDKKTPSEGIPEKISVPEIQQDDKKSDKKITETFNFPETQPNNDELDNMMDKKTIDKAKLPETQQENLLMDRKILKRISSEDNSPDTKKEIWQPDKAEVSRMEKVGMSTTATEGSAATVLSPSKPDKYVEEGEDLTGLLWAEWSHRFEGLDMQGAGAGQISSTTFNIADLWQNLQTYTMFVVMKVVVITAWVFGRSESVGLVVSMSLVLLFYLGRLRTSGQDLSDTEESSKENRDNQSVQSFNSDMISKGSSGEGFGRLFKVFTTSWDALLRIPGLKKFISKGKTMLDDGKGEETNTNYNVLMKGEPSVNSDWPETEKLWKGLSNEGVLSDAKKDPARSISDSFRLKELVPKDKVILVVDKGEEIFLTDRVPRESEGSNKRNQLQNEILQERQPKGELSEPEKASATSVLSFSGSKKSTRKHKQVLDAVKGERDFKAGKLPTEGEASSERDKLQQTSGKRESRGVLADTEERHSLSTWDKSLVRSISSAGGRLAPAVNYSSNALGYRSSRDLAIAAESGPAIAEVISSEVEPSKFQSSEAAFVGLKSHLYSPTTSVISYDISSSMLEASSNQPEPGKLQGQGQVDSVTATFKDLVEERDQGKISRSEASTLSDSVIIGTPYVVNLHRRTEISVSNTVLSVQGRDKGSSSELPVTSPGKPDHLWKTMGSTNQSSKQISGAGRHGNASVRKSDKDGASNGIWREADCRTANQSEAEHDSFIHGQSLWVRDADGVFMQQPCSKAETKGSMLASSSGGPEDMPRSSSREPQSSGNLVSTDHLSPVGTKKVTTVSTKGFDYRKLFIKSKLLPEDQHGLKTSGMKCWTKVAGRSDGQLMLPLSFAPEQDNISW